MMEPNSNPSRKRARSPSPEDDAPTTNPHRRRTKASRPGAAPETLPVHEDLPNKQSEIKFVDQLPDAPLAESKTRTRRAERVLGNAKAKKEVDTRAQTSIRSFMTKPSPPKKGKPSAKPKPEKDTGEHDEDYEDGDATSGDVDFAGSPTLDSDVSEVYQDASVKAPIVTGNATIKTKKYATKDGTTKSKQRGVDTSLPPMSDLYDIFKDIIDKALTKGLYDTIADLACKVINVATMCSGTESPLLAWQMFQDGMFLICTYYALLMIARIGIAGRVPRFPAQV